MSIKTSAPKVRVVAGPADPISNFYCFPFKFCEVEHISVEHAYQMSKAQWFGFIKDAWPEIANAPNASADKRVSDKYFKSDIFKKLCAENHWQAKRLELWEQDRAGKVLRIREAS